MGWEEQGQLHTDPGVVCETCKTAQKKPLKCSWDKFYGEEESDHDIVDLGSLRIWFIDFLSDSPCLFPLGIGCTKCIGMAGTYVLSN